MHIITFEDLSIWQGGEPNNSRWNEMPNKAIKKIEYSLFNAKISFENYEAYNHIVEHSTMLFGNELPRITKILLIAKKGNISYIYTFDLLAKEGYTRSVEFGKEINDREVTGWKKGLENKETTYKIEDLK